MKFFERESELLFDRLFAVYSLLGAGGCSQSWVRKGSGGAILLTTVEREPEARLGVHVHGALIHHRICAPVRVLDAQG